MKGTVIPGPGPMQSIDGIARHRCGNACEAQLIPDGADASAELARAIEGWDHKYLRKLVFGVQKRPGLALSGVARSDRFWHGPGRFEAALVGRVGLLFVRPP
jgi:hypothetical protein